MALLKDLRVLYHLALSPVRGRTHAERLNSFYAGQAKDYDDFRKRLLHGREDLVGRLPLPPGAVWVDIGGGTGANIEMAAERVPQLGSVHVVDLCGPLLVMALERFAERGWPNAFAVEADACGPLPIEGQADVVTFSYSLTMIPEWWRAIDQALAILKPGGTLGVTDFYVSKKYPAEGRARHGAWTRVFWPAWFSQDNVFLNPDHLPYLESRVDAVEVLERRGKVPYLPLGRVPYYVFLGRKRG